MENEQRVITPVEIIQDEVVETKHKLIVVMVKKGVLNIDSDILENSKP